MMTSQIVSEDDHEQNFEDGCEAIAGVLAPLSE